MSVVNIEKADKKPPLRSFNWYVVAILAVFGIAIFEQILDSRPTSKVFPMPQKALNKRPKVQHNNKTTRRWDKAIPAISNKFVNRTLRIITHVPTHGMLKNDLSLCVFRNCQTFVSRNTTDADAIIIQGSKPSKPLPVRENNKQIMIFASLETPMYLNYVNLNNPFWNRYYNWTMTYRRDSDIPYMYGYVYPKYLSKKTVFTQLQSDSIFDKRMYLEYEEEVFKNPTGIENKNYSNIFRLKNVTASWLVSHCGTASRREDYVNIMRKIIRIDKIGKCGKRSCPKRSINKCDETLVKYSHFYIAFENSVCNDYITEKVFNWFEKDIVIVARGARNYSFHLPKGTYIDANDFKNATELADFLKRLSSNEGEYVKYLKRKDMYRVFQRGTMVQLAFCNLCRKLNNIELYGKTFNIQKSWSNGACIVRNKIKL